MNRRLMYIVVSCRTGTTGVPQAGISSNNELNMCRPLCSYAHFGLYDCDIDVGSHINSTSTLALSTPSLSIHLTEYMVHMQTILFSGTSTRMPIDEI